MWLWRSWVRAPPLTPFSSKPLGLSLGCRQEVKARDFDSRTVGSNPATPARFDPLAQSVEHLTFNQGVRSSNLRWITRKDTAYCRVFLFAQDIASGCSPSIPHPFQCPQPLVDTLTRMVACSFQTIILCFVHQTNRRLNP